MNNTIICAIVVVMLASNVVVAKPRNNQTNGSDQRAVLPSTGRPGKRGRRGWQNRHHAIADNAMG
jgi:hypothetical protein